MANLRYGDRIKLEKLFDMEGGYVINFTDRTFREFVQNSIGRDINATIYRYGSSSKANRLRRLWEIEPNAIASKLLHDLIELASDSNTHRDEKDLITECIRIADSLLGDRTEDHSITEVTRRGIVDRLAAGNHNWAGGLTEDAFLSRLYDLDTLPSNDQRYTTAAEDIWQHRVNNNDWESDWIFYDRRFELLDGPDDAFLRFLCETVHPAVRQNRIEADTLVDLYNEQLRQDGWEIAQITEISGRPVFGALSRNQEAEIFNEPTGWPKVDRQVGEIRLRLREAKNEEHFQVIGHLCREVLISLAENVYDPERHPAVDGKSPSCTDAKRMLEAFVAIELPGRSNETARKHVRSAVDLANDVQHDRAATFRDAALCAEATLSIIRIIAIISERRERRIGLDA